MALSKQSISNKGYQNHHLSIKYGQRVTLTRVNSRDETRLWYTVGSEDVRDAFAIVNRHTKQAIKATGKDKPVQLVPVPLRRDGTIKSELIDQSLLWIEDTENDLDENYNPIRVYSDPEVVLHAEGQASHGGGYILIFTRSWEGKDNQLWNITTADKAAS